MKKTSATEATATKTVTPPKKGTPIKPGSIKSLDANCIHKLITAYGNEEDKEAQRSQYFTVQILTLRDIEADKAGSAQVAERSEKDKNKAVKYK